MKKILWNLQLSSVSKSTGRLQVLSDSNWSFNLNCIKALPDYEHHVIIPCLSDIESYTAVIAELDKRQIYFHELKKRNRFGVFTSRYEWNNDKIEDILMSVRPDLIWENNPSLVMNWKTLLLELSMIDKVPVITYNHWIDNNMFPKIDARCTYQFRQHEGYYASDLVGVNSYYAQNVIYDGFKFTPWNDNHVSIYLDLSNKFFVLPPIIDDKLIEQLKPKEALFGKKTIVFNHRLSSLPYYRKNWEACLAVWDHAIEKHDFQVIVTDNSGKGLSEKDNRSYIVHKPNMPYDEYIRTLWKSDIHMTLFDFGNGGTWSMSLAEAILTNNICIAYRHSGYEEMIPPQSGSFHTQLDVALSVCRDNKYKVSHKTDTQEKTFYTLKYSFDILAEKLNGIVEKAIQKK
jgi:hypothetical protein